MLGKSHSTHIFLDSFPDVLTSASVDLQNESSVAVAHRKPFPQVCLNRPVGIYRRGHMMRVILDALHRTLHGRWFISHDGLARWYHFRFHLG